MFCNKCGKGIKEDSVFCNYCGNQINNENTKNVGDINKEESVENKATNPSKDDEIYKVCPNCGKLIKWKDKVCSYCNTPYHKAEFQQIRGGITHPTISDKNFITAATKRPISIVLVVLLGVAFLVTLLGLIVSKNTLLAIIIYFPIFIIITFSLIFVNLRKIKSRSLGFLITTCVLLLILIISSVAFSNIQNKKNIVNATTQSTEKVNKTAVESPKTNIPETTQEIKAAESTSQQVKIDDYNDRLDKFSNLLLLTQTMYSTYWPKVESFNNSLGDDPVSNSSICKKIVSEFKIWQNDLSNIEAPNFANDFINYFVEWTILEQEFYTYLSENTTNIDVAKTDELREKMQTSLKKATNEGRRLSIVFNQEAGLLGLDIPFSNIELELETTGETLENPAELGTKENPWPFETEVKGKEVSWKLLLAKDLGNKLESKNMFVEDKTTTGKFIRVEAVLKNIGSSKIDSTFVTFNIVDNKGREFGELPESYAYTGEDISADYIEEINPGMERNYIFIFEVPLDAIGLMFEATDLEIIFASKTYISLDF